MIANSRGWQALACITFTILCCSSSVYSGIDLSREANSSKVRPKLEQRLEWFLLAACSATDRKCKHGED